MQKVVLLPTLMLLNKALTWHAELLREDNKEQLSFGILCGKEERRQMSLSKSFFSPIFHWLNFTLWNINFPITYNLHHIATSMTVQDFKYHNCCDCISSNLNMSRRHRKQNKIWSVAGCYALMSKNKGLCHGMTAWSRR